MQLLPFLFYATALPNGSQDALGPIVLTTRRPLELAATSKINDFGIQHLQRARVKFNSAELLCLLNESDKEHIYLPAVIKKEGRYKLDQCQEHAFIWHQSVSSDNLFQVHF